MGRRNLGFLPARFFLEFLIAAVAISLAERHDFFLRAQYAM
jgi:hypothetical protein